MFLSYTYLEVYIFRFRSNDIACMALQALQFLMIVLLFFGCKTVHIVVDCAVSENVENPGESLENRNFLIVSTANGELSAFDTHNGKIVWSMRTEPGELISSSMKKLEANERGQKIRLVPSLDGNLFKFDGKKLEPLPVSAEALLRNSYKVGDNLLIIGGKEITGYGINMKTGEVHYVCKSDGCKQMSYVSPEETILIVERHTQAVRAVSARNGDDQWNFRVSEHRISVSQGIAGHSLPVDYSNTAIRSKALLLPPDKKEVISFEAMAKVDMLKGVIGIRDQETNEFKWSQKLSSPIVDVWQVKGGTVKSYDLLDESAENISEENSFSSHSLLLVGSYDEKLYIKKSDSKRYNPHKIARAHFYPVVSDTIKTELDEFSSSSELSSLALMISDSNYPYVAFSYSEDTHSAANSTYCFRSQRNKLKFMKDEVFSILYHWKEVIIFSSILTVIVNTIVYMICRKIKRNSDKLFDGSALSSISMKSEDQCNSYSELSECNQNEYVSRYLTDFEPITCLGRGGYGVVFEAKNKIDDCCYAVKRIKLTNRDTANDRIMREVKALAKLDHAGIVRYFNSWVENPPQNWQDAKDKELEKFRLDPSSEISDSSRNKTIPESTSCNHFGFVNPLKPFDHEILDFSKHKYLWKSENKSAFGRETDVSNDNRTSCSVTLHSKKKSEECPDCERTFDQTKPKKYDMFLYIQMQLCQRESLKDWLLFNDVKRDRDEVLHIFYQIVCAVEYVHQCGLIHRDLKPSNIFFSLDGVVKIGDFGLVAPMLCDDSKFVRPILQQSKRKKLFKHSDLVGTQLYMSPEQVQRSLYNHKVDIFSLGMIFYELLVPFKTQSERIKVLTRIKQHMFPKRFRKKYDSECTFVSKLLSHNPGERPSASEIKEHQMLKKFHQIIFTVTKQSPLYNVSFSSTK